MMMMMIPVPAVFILSNFTSILFLCYFKLLRDQNKITSFYSCVLSNPRKNSQWSVKAGWSIPQDRRSIPKTAVIPAEVTMEKKLHNIVFCNSQSPQKDEKCNPKVSSLNLSASLAIETSKSENARDCCGGSL